VVARPRECTRTLAVKRGQLCVFARLCAKDTCWASGGISCDQPCGIMNHDFDCTVFISWVNDLMTGRSAIGTVEASNFGPH
jgi:hypothetical protein